MAVWIEGCLEKLTQILQQTSIALTEAEDMHARQADQATLNSMRQQLTLLNSDLLSAVFKAQQAFGSCLTWEALCLGPCGAAGSARVIKEHGSCVKAVSTSITASVKLLNLLTNAPIVPIPEHSVQNLAMFETVWEMLRTSGAPMQLWPMAWPVDHLTNYSSYLHTQQLLTSWLLTLTRGNSPIWSQIQHVASAHRRLLATLGPALNCIHRLDDMYEMDLFAAVLRLPHGFLSNLCCLMCDGLRYGQTLDSTVAGFDINADSFAQCLMNLSTSVGLAITHWFPEESAIKMCRALLSPAAIEAAKLTIVVCSRVKKSSHTEEEAAHLRMMVVCAQPTIFARLMHHALQDEFRQTNTQGVAQTPSAGQSSGSSCSSSSRVAEHARSNIPPWVQISDCTLLCALQICTPPWSNEFCDGFSAMSAVVGEWGEPDPLVAGERVACLLIVLRHVFDTTLGWMQLQQRSQADQGAVTPMHVKAMDNMRLMMVNILTGFRRIVGSGDVAGMSCCNVRRYQGKYRSCQME